MKYRWALAAFVIVLIIGWYLWGPAGGDLTSLNQGDFPQFAERFNAAGSDERILLLVSPT